MALIILSTKIHCRLGVVDKYGNVIILSPKTTGDNIDILSKSGILHGKFGDMTTFQNIINRISAIAYNKTFLGIGDSDTSSSVKTWSADKILSEYDAIHVIVASAVSKFKANCGAIMDGFGLSHSVSPTAVCNKIADECTSAKSTGYNAGYNLATSGLTATADDVLWGETYAGADGTWVSGLLLNSGTYTDHLWPGDSITVKGYTGDGSKDEYFENFTIYSYRLYTSHTSISQVSYEYPSTVTRDPQGRMILQMTIAVNTIDSNIPVSKFRLGAFGFTNIMIDSVIMTYGTIGTPVSNLGYRLWVDDINVYCITDLTQPTATYDKLYFRADIYVADDPVFETISDYIDRVSISIGGTFEVTFMYIPYYI